MLPRTFRLNNNRPLANATNLILPNCTQASTHIHTDMNRHTEVSSEKQILKYSNTKLIKDIYIKKEKLIKEEEMYVYV